MGIEKLINEAQSNSANLLKSIVFIASGLIDNQEKISAESLERIGSGLVQLDKNISASGDVIKRVNLFIETLSWRDENEDEEAQL